MGLDMFLDRKQNFGGFDRAMKEAQIVGEDGEVKHKVPAGRYGRIETQTNIAYWRKSNQIHRWFVEKCGEGEDNGQYMSVSIEQLRDLLELCKEVKHQAKFGIGLVKIFGTGGKLGGKYSKATPVYDDDGRIAALTTDEPITDTELLMVGDYFVVVEDEHLEKESNGKTIFYHIDAAERYSAYVFGTTIINSEVIEDLLPTQEGFFFGDTDYNEYYMEDIDLTIEQLESIIAEHQDLIAEGAKEYDLEYIYYASW